MVGGVLCVELKGWFSECSQFSIALRAAQGVVSLCRIKALVRRVDSECF